MDKSIDKRKKRLDVLYKKDKQSLARIVEQNYSVVDTKGAPKAVLISMIMEAEFGRSK